MTLKDELQHLEAIALRLEQDAMPDPNDERDIDPNWLAERMAKAAASIRRNVERIRALRNNQ